MSGRWQRVAGLLALLRSQLQQSRGAKASTTKLPVMLLKDVESLGSAGRVLKVNHGYARNHLIPQRLAVIAHGAEGAGADASSSSQAVAAAADAPGGLAEQQRQAEVALKKLTSTPIVIKRKTGDGQTLDVAVSKEDIAEAVGRQLRVAMHPELLDIGTDRLSVVGEYRLPLKLVLASGERGMLDVNISST